MALEPWLIEAALERLGDRMLTVEERKVVWKAGEGQMAGVVGVDG
jgi:hypothetical protein